MTTTVNIVIDRLLKNLCTKKIPVEWRALKPN